MAEITVPTMVQILNKLCTDLQSLSPETNPFETNSLLRNEFKALSNRINSVYQLIKQVPNQVMIKTATGEFLENTCLEVGITRNPATQGSGHVSFQGVAATVIPVDNETSDSDGKILNS